MRSRSNTCFFVLPEGSGKKDFLHHILIQSGHHDNDEDTAEKLFEEVLPRYPVVKYKNTAMFTTLDCLDNTVKVKV